MPIGTHGNAARPLAKLATGIEGFDELSGGGLPRHRTSSAHRRPGCGQDGLRSAMPRERCEPAARGRHLRCVRGESRPDHRQRRHLQLGTRRACRARSSSSWMLICRRRSSSAGDFDLSGMLAMLAAKKQEIGAQWIVFDGIDVLLTLLQNRSRRNAGNLPPARLARGQRLDCDHHGQSRRSHVRPHALRLPAIHGRLRSAPGATPAGPRLRTKHSDHQVSGFELRAGRVPDEHRAVRHRGGCRRPCADRAPGVQRADHRGLRAPGRDARRWRISRQQHADHRRAGHCQDDLGRQIRGSGLPARRARIVRELR